MRPSPWAIACLSFACLSASAGTRDSAAPPSVDLFDVGAPSFTTFSERDGVPASVAVSVQTDADGYVWMASAHQLARYDGRRWSSSGAAALEGSSAELLVDHDGVLWAGFRDRGIAQYDGEKWQVENVASGFPTNHVRRLTETVDGEGHYELWAATADAGLVRRDGDRWTAAPGNEQLPAGVLCVARTHSLGGERLWAGTFNEGLWFREEGAPWQRLHSDAFDPAQIEHLLTVDNGGHEELWIAAFGGGLWRLDAGGLRNWSVANGELPTNELYDIAQSRAPDGDHVIWVASRSGLIRIRNERAQTFDRRHGLPSNVVRNLSVWHSPDGVDVLWLATEGGIARAVLGASRWQTASLMGAQSIGVFGVLLEPDDNGGERLWVGATGDGLALYENGRWRSFTRANGSLPDSDVRMVKRARAVDGENALWIGQRGGYLLRVRDGPKFEVVATPWEKQGGQAVMDTLGRVVDGHGEQWVATRQSGLWRWRDGAWNAFRPADAVGQWRTVRLLEQVDSDGRSWLWATSNQGLARFDGRRWQLLGREAGLPDVALSGMSLIPDPGGRPLLWLGSLNAGIVRVDVGEPEHPRVLPADLPRPPDPTAYGAVRDSLGHVYVCTNYGVQRLTPRGDGWQSETFTRSDGLVHEECNTNAQFIDAHDRFWTGTLGGLAVFDPSIEIHDTQAKPLKLTAAQLDGEAIAPAQLRIPAGKHELRVEFALLAWQREGESRFRTQLLGYEAAPGAWRADNFRTFNALPSGDYVLRVEARDYAGNVSTPVELPISIVPGWWQRDEARGAAAIGALLAGWALLRWRTRSILMQRRRLETEVAERTAELHAANALLRELSYQDALTGLSNRRSLLEALESMAAAGTAAALVFVDVDHFKDYNDHFGHPAGDEALRRVAATIQAVAPAAARVARYGGEEFACLLADTALDAALHLAECMRAAVEVCDVAVPGTDTVNRVTISAGVATRELASNDDAYQLLRDADNALYQAKSDGRNCVRP